MDFETIKTFLYKRYKKIMIEAKPRTLIAGRGNTGEI